MYGKFFNQLLPYRYKCLIAVIILMSVMHQNPATKLDEAKDTEGFIAGKAKFKSMVFDPTRKTKSVFTISEGSPLHIILSREKKGHCEMFFMHFKDLSIKRANDSRKMTVCVTQLQTDHLTEEKCHWVNNTNELMINQGNLYGMPKDCGPWYLTVLINSKSKSNHSDAELSVEVSEPYDPLVFRWFRVITNLAFVPGIVIALRRKFYAEGIVYFLNFACSCVYHLCESELHCVKGYDRLHMSDIYSSDLSIIVTVWTMTGIQAPLKHIIFLTIAILLQFVLGTNTDSSFHFFVNLCFAGLPLFYFFFRNLQRSIKLRRCFPHTKRWTFQVIPGLLLAGTGAVINLILSEDENYYYVHCIWHITIMLSVAFLLPTKEDEEEEAWFDHLEEDKESYTALI